MISERVKQVVTEEIASHQAAIIDLEKFLDSDGESKVGQGAVEGLKAKGKGPVLTDAQKAKQRRKVKEYWRKKKLAKLAEQAAQAGGGADGSEPVAEAADASAPGVPLLAAAK